MPTPTPTPIAFVPTDAAESRADSPATRIGGQPDWLEEPQWPLSAEDDEPMRFIGQFRLSWADTEEPVLAYLFLADGPDDTFIPDGGENALIIQPGGRVPDFISTRPDAAGPTHGDAHVPRPTDGKPDMQFLGGPGIEPAWLQGEETPFPDWHLVVQLDSTCLPFDVNFGDAGVGYAFVSPDLKEGRFLWQCS